MPSSPRRRCLVGPLRAHPALWVALALGLVAATAGAAPPRAGDDQVGAAVYEALAAAGEVRVIIAVRPPGPPPWAAPPGDVRARVDEILQSVAGPGIAVKRRFGNVRAFAAVVDADGLDRLARHPLVVRIDLDAPGGGRMTESAPLAQIPALTAQGLTGWGTRIAVLDTGLDRNHADLGGALVDEACFCSGGGGCCWNGSDTDSGPASALDDHGHGSNVSGVIVSDGFVSPIGAAIDAEIVAVKVLDYTASFCCSSDVVAGLDWIATNHPEVDVVNLSLGTDAAFPGNCDAATSFTMAFADAVTTLRAQGILSIASSGNDGSGTELQAPACVADAMSVAAAWDASVGAQAVLGCVDLSTQPDQITCYSNTNSVLDLVASANPMTSAGLNVHMSTFVGTSNASPLASACALLLRQSRPQIMPDGLESALTTSPVSVTDVTNGLSFPRLDCLAALDEAKASTPAPIPLLGAGLLALLATLSGCVLVLALDRGRPG